MPYISNTRPTVFQTLLSRFGIIELPTKVNCWYCSQDSFLLPGTKNTSRHWFCHLCENVNVRDSTGEIVDPSAFETTRQSDTPITPSPRPLIEHGQRTLCENCQENQNMIYQLLSDYIPDETDPEFNYRYDNADNHKADLHKRYPLCHDCQSLINSLAEEQQDALQNRTLLEVEHRSRTAVIPTRPSKQVHLTKGMLWSLIHFATLMYLLRSILYPPSYVHITDVHYRKIVGIIQYTISSIRHDAFDMNSFVESVKDLALHFIDSLLESLKTVSTCLLKNDETCQNQSVAIDTMILFNISSLLFFSWHYLTRNVYGDTERLKNWNYYQKIQWLLFFLRFLSVALVAMQVSRTFLIATFASYSLLLLVSVVIVKRKCGIWNLKSVGKQGSLTTNDDEYDDVDIHRQTVDPRNEDTAEFSVQENEDNMSIVEELNGLDNIDHIVSDFDLFHINQNRRHL